jgi:hypothetical protein
MAASKQAARKTVIKRSRGSYGREGTRIDPASYDTRYSNRKALGPVGSVIGKFADALTKGPQTKLEKKLEPLTYATPAGGMLKGATVKGVSGLKSAVPQRQAAEKALAKRRAKAQKREAQPARRAEARANRRRFYKGKVARKGEREREIDRLSREMDRLASGDRSFEEPPWLKYQKPLKQQVEETKYWRNHRKGK